MNELERLQKTELYLLQSFDKVCREQRLVYFLDSGTALGAVRHGGFIPWDDDIDVGMPRTDYEKFLKHGQSFLPDDIFLQTRETEKGYMRNAAKLRLKGTYFPERISSPYKHCGIFIDIFPFDNVSSNKMLAKWNIKLLTELNHMVISYRSSKSSKSRLRRYFQKTIKFLPSSWFDALERLYLSATRFYNSKETRYMTCYFWRMTLTKQYIFETKKMLPVKDILFEGIPVKIMNNPDYYLAKMYGNYMQMPPKEQRKVHCQGNIDFGSKF